jgi:hypothetical protein
VSRILAVRRRLLALRRGRQYLREISGDGVHFGYPVMLGSRLLSVVPWSRLFDDTEVLCAINTDGHQPIAAWTVVDQGLHQAGRRFRCAYSTDESQIGTEMTVENRGPMRAVRLQLPPAGFVIYEQVP